MKVIYYSAAFRLSFRPDQSDLLIDFKEDVIQWRRRTATVEANGPPNTGPNPDQCRALQVEGSLPGKPGNPQPALWPCVLLAFHISLEAVDASFISASAATII